MMQGYLFRMLFQDSEQPSDRSQFHERLLLIHTLDDAIENVSKSAPAILPIFRSEQ